MISMQHDHDFIHELKPLTLGSIKASGAVVGKLNGKKIAAYSDGETIKAVSAICTHKFCIVQPEFADTSNERVAASSKQGAALAWYCPCHGARFKLSGEVINGPADKPLPEIKLKVEDEILKLDE